MNNCVAAAQGRNFARAKEAGNKEHVFQAFSLNPDCFAGKHNGSPATKKQKPMFSNSVQLVITGDDDPDKSSERTRPMLKQEQVWLSVLPLSHDTSFLNTILIEVSVSRALDILLGAFLLFASLHVVVASIDGYFLNPRPWPVFQERN